MQQDPTPPPIQQPQQQPQAFVNNMPSMSNFTQGPDNGKIAPSLSSINQQQPQQQAAYKPAGQSPPQPYDFGGFNIDGSSNRFPGHQAGTIERDANGNPIGVTQSGNNPLDDKVYGGGQRLQPGAQAPGQGTLGTADRDRLLAMLGRNPDLSFIGGNGGPGGGTGSPAQPGGGGGSPLGGFDINQLFQDPRFRDLFGQGGFEGIGNRVGAAETNIGNQIGGLGDRFNNVDTGLGGIRSAQDAQTNLLGGQIGGVGDRLSGELGGLGNQLGGRFNGVDTGLGNLQTGQTGLRNDITSGFSGIGDQMGGRFNSVDSALGAGFGGIEAGQRDLAGQVGGIGTDMSNRFGDLNTGLDSRFSGLQGNMDSQFGGLGAGQRNIQDLLGTGAGSLQSRIGQDIGGVNTNINDRFNSLNGGIAGLGSDISSRFDNTNERFNSLDTSLGGQSDMLGKIRGDITGVGGNVDARYNDIQGLIDALGGQVGSLAGDVNSRTQIGDLLKNFTGENFTDPAILNDVQTAIQSRLKGNVADDPRVQLQLADLEKSQGDRKAQRIEELKRIGINADDGNYFSEGDKLGESFNRERLNVLANGENMRTADFGTGINLGSTQGGIDNNQSRLNLDKFLGTGDLGVREKEADSRIKAIDAQIKQASQKRDDDMWAQIFGTAAKALPFLL